MFRTGGADGCAWILASSSSNRRLLLLLLVVDVTVLAVCDVRWIEPPLRDASYDGASHGIAFGKAGFGDEDF